MDTTHQTGAVRRVLRALAIPLLAVAGAVGLRRKVVAGRNRRRGDDGGGTAGVREPRHPVPTPLVDSGAGVPN